MQSTEIDALLRDLEESRLHAQSAHLFRSAELTFRAITALAAERDRADRAEARLALLTREQVHQAVIAAGFNISARLSEGDITSLWGALVAEATA